MVLLLEGGGGGGGRSRAVGGAGPAVRTLRDKFITKILLNIIKVHITHS